MSGPSLAVEGLTFTFPAGWVATKYDEWSFYRNQFGRMHNGIKAVDLITLSEDATAWFIEVKDYRAQQRTKPSDLSEEIFEKVFDTLAALLPASVNANDAHEKNLATSFLAAKRLRVVFHLEQPTKQSRLRPRAINPVDIAQKLRRLLKAVDAHPIVAEMSAMGRLHWSVR